ncbi:MAG: hypothetical protein ACOX6G_00825 [Christensenellales bacterium]
MEKVLGKSFVTGILLGLLVALISFISIFAFISITKTTMISEQPFSYPRPIIRTAIGCGTWRLAP